jgi:hypothetical protein
MYYTKNENTFVLVKENEGTTFTTEDKEDCREQTLLI